ncbi:hypothetical protein FPCIR_3119 [Fusarium pseudocircinatum]|uniref:Uncharacterized protein n=1 Tax=Fusarium pseudocircinatum TaxID=56676 RepID=A0A8H5PKH5_9HYPO|nr:hypothetical protein FPCIR_3119 [Fusarium pseudocircinatum]
MPGGDVTTEVLLKVTDRDLEQADTVFESFLPHDAIKPYLTGPETGTALRQITKYFEPKDHKQSFSIGTTEGNKCQVQFHLQDGFLRSPPPCVGALLQGAQRTLLEQDVEFSYRIPEARMLLPKDFGLQLIKLARTNREDFRLMWFGITLTDQDEESPGVEDMNPDDDCSEASDVGEDSDSTDGGSEYCPSDQDDDDDDGDGDFCTDQNLTILNSYLAMLGSRRNVLGPLSYQRPTRPASLSQIREEHGDEPVRQDPERGSKPEKGAREKTDAQETFLVEEEREESDDEESLGAEDGLSGQKYYETEVNFRKFNAQIPEYLAKMQYINLEDSMDVKSCMEKILSENERKKLRFSEQDEEAMAQTLPDGRAYQQVARNDDIRSIITKHQQRYLELIQNHVRFYFAVGDRQLLHNAMRGWMLLLVANATSEATARVARMLTHPSAQYLPIQYALGKDTWSPDMFSTVNNIDMRYSGEPKDVLAAIVL